MSSSPDVLARAMAMGEALVHDALQRPLIGLLACAPADQRYAAVSGVMCRVTSLLIVLVGQEQTKRILATSVEAAEQAPAEACAAAQDLRDRIDQTHASKELH